jgi:hypothetical protein
MTDATPDSADQERVNPAARRDRPGEDHDDLERRPEPPSEPPRGYQEGELDPRDHGGIAE